MSILLCSSLLVAAGVPGKKFDVKSGEIVFDISGGGEVAEGVHISVQGKGTLHFSDWGVLAFMEENYEEVASGRLHYMQKTQICEKFENKQRFDVDFETEKILERPMPKGNFQTYFLENMVKTGQETIAGYPCDMWEGAGMKKCLYKGIPLLVEYHLMGIQHVKKAVKVDLGIKVEPSKCQLPDFPVEKFALFKTNIKTKSIKLPKDLSALLFTLSKSLHKTLAENKMSEENLSAPEKKKWLNKVGEHIFEAEKQFLPHILSTMKEARVCLSQAEDKNEANACILDVINMKKEVMSDKNDNYISAWDEPSQQRIMDEFDDNIEVLESKMKCIRASKNISDLSACMKPTS